MSLRRDDLEDPFPQGLLEVLIDYPDDVPDHTRPRNGPVWAEHVVGRPRRRRQTRVRAPGACAFARPGNFFDNRGIAGSMATISQFAAAEQTVLDVCGGAGHTIRRLAGRARQFVVLIDRLHARDAGHRPPRRRGGGRRQRAVRGGQRRGDAVRGRLLRHRREPLQFTACPTPGPWSRGRWREWCGRVAASR